MKKTISIVMALLICLCCLPVTGFAAGGNTTEFAGGSGTAEDPYLIATKAHLDNVRFYTSAHFKMIADIEFSDADFKKGGAFYNNGSGWEPIGYYPDYFTGTFDGDGHRISNFYINRDAICIGFFGAVDSGAVIRNVSVLDADITAKDKAAGIVVGLLDEATIENCYSSGEIHGVNSVGGIVGQLQTSTIKNCCSAADVYGTDSVGGIVGATYENCTVSYCAATGSVTGAKYVGGIGGYINPYVDSSADPSVKIEYCCNDAELVSGTSYVGGIIGYIYTTCAYDVKYVQGSYGGASYSYISWYSPKEAHIKNCYNAGDVKAATGSASGIVGESLKTSGPYSDSSKNVHKSEVINCYNCGNIEAETSTYAISKNSGGLAVSNSYYLEGCVETNSGGGTKLTHNQMRAQSVFSGWDFSTVWTMAGRADYLYPELRDVKVLYPEDMKHKHTYTSKITIPATHLAEGVKTFSCVCGKSYTEAIAKLTEHTYEESVTPPTCEEKGYTTFTCACGDTYTKEMDALGHKYTSKITTPATHTAEGVKTFSCACGKSYTEAIAKLEGHSYKSAVTAPTCEEKGYTTYTCACGDTYTEETDALGHSFIEKIIDEAHLVSVATTQSPAVYKYDCASCDAISDELTFTYGDKLAFSGKTSKITATQTTNTVKLTWSAVDGANIYRVYQKNSSGWKKLADVTSLNYTINNLKSGTKYTFAVKAGEKLDGKTVWAKGYTAIDTVTKAAKLSKVTATQTTSAIKLTWSKVSGATGYRVYQKINGQWKILKSATTSTSYTIKNLKAGTKYTFAVKPYIKTDSGNVWSAYTQLTTATKPVNPTIKVASPSKGKVTVSWNAVKGAEAYQLWYKTANGSYKLYKTYDAVKNLAFKNLKSGTKYTFAVRAVIKTDAGNVRSGYKAVAVTVK